MFKSALFRPRQQAVAAAVILGAVALSANARAATFMDTLGGVVGSYNLYLSGDLGSSASPLQWSDTEGKVAVGGSAYLRGYDIALKSPGGTALVVGHDLRMESGTVHGDVVVGGNASFPTTYGGTTVQGVVTTGGALGVAPTSYGGHPAYAGLPLDFAATTADLVLASNYLNSADAKSQGSLGAASTSYGALKLTSASGGLVFFDLAASQLVGINGLTFDVRPGSTVIVNVTGQPAGFIGNFSFFGDYQASSTLFNFVDATGVSLSNLAFMGSILAPNADLIGNNGQINGSIVAKSYSGTAQINQARFGGLLPNVLGAVPEPATWTMMILGFGAMGAMLRRRARRLGAAAA